MSFVHERSEFSSLVSMKRTSHILVIYTLTLILLCQPLAIFSQMATGSLCGTVTDTLGALIPRARVIATLRDALATGGPRVFETKTNDEGKFNLTNLPSGVYEVRLISDGSEAQVERIVSVPKGTAVEIAIEFGRSCERISDRSGVVGDEDRAEVIRLSLARAFSSKSGLLEQERRDKGVILSTSNIKPEWVKDVQGIRIRLMNQKQIQRRADREGDFLYISFPEVRVIGTCIAVTVTNGPAV
ncbi:MAG: Carboxypeptidase regulatory-like domain, partial [Blastocatellia bacterium]|nr:Carboxypeptidase regulatory-like domain [Blastocatellia bacterium]